MDFNQNIYVDEIIQLIRATSDTEMLLEALENYHENDIAESLEFLSKEERIALYSVLGIEWVSEIFAYLEDYQTTVRK